MSGVSMPQKKQTSGAEYALLGLQSYQTFAQPKPAPAAVDSAGTSAPVSASVNPDPAAAAMDRRAMNLRYGMR